MGGADVDTSNLRFNTSQNTSPGRALGPLINEHSCPSRRFQMAWKCLMLLWRSHTCKIHMLLVYHCKLATFLWKWFCTSVSRSWSSNWTASNAASTCQAPRPTCLDSEPETSEQRPDRLPPADCQPAQGHQVTNMVPLLKAIKFRMTTVCKILPFDTGPGRMETATVAHHGG